MPSLTSLRTILVGVVLTAPAAIGAVSLQEAHSMIGLLKLPAVFGTDDCTPYPKRPIPLYAAVDASSPLGEIRVAGSGSDGDCASREVRVFLSGQGQSELPTLEHGYELRSAIVRRQSGAHYEIALTGRAAWVRAVDAGEFLPVPKLFDGQLLYLTRDAPGAGMFEGKEPEVELIGTERSGGELRLRVRVLPRRPCGGETVQGGGTTLTIPFLGRGGRPSIWFHSRGC